MDFGREGGWGKHISLAAIFEGKHISLVICVQGNISRGNTYHCDTGTINRGTHVYPRMSKGYLQPLV